MNLLVPLAAEASSTNDLASTAGLITAIAAVLSVIGLFVRDRMQAKNQAAATAVEARRAQEQAEQARDQAEQSHANSATAASVEYIKQALGGFEDLVSQLRDEINRLHQQRSEADARYRISEEHMLDEIARLRAEVRHLRLVLEQHNIDSTFVPPQ